VRPKLGIDTFVPDPVTGFGSRAALIADLWEAVDPQATQRVLAVFGLDGLDEFGKIYGAAAMKEVIARLAGEFAQMLAGEATCYAPRRREFCALFPLPLHEVEPILAAAAIALRREGAMTLISTAFGVCVLPDQAGDPVLALTVADKNLTRARRLQRKVGARSG
jgi:GGDEF domain-containing protein